MNPLKTQGRAFILLATLVTAASLVLPRLDERAERLGIALLVVALGVPHGALDAVFARRLYRVQGVTGWLGFGMSYTALAGLGLGLWIFAPSLFLLAFLLISLAHFSGDPAAGTPPLARILYGGAILVLPALRHAPEVARLFSLLVGEDAASFAAALHALSWPWLIALGISAAIAASSHWLTALELVAVGGLAVLAPPLAAFAIFFCGMHSARHILRTVALSPDPPARVLGEALLPMLAALILFGAALWRLPGLSLDARVIQFLFVGLAALTVPHMLLVEQVRLTGWSEAPLAPAKPRG
ncbi:MAG: Brp/Blh family beta-carotene 15,15'-dioxygenase [Bryobacteraceae bacterium]|nr:Brp/Blh family beta-carotene 15,15'-dioxygenase [Bryobacteraceae bacterium]